MNFFDFQIRAWVASDEQVEVLVHSSPVGGMRQPVKVLYKPAEFESVCGMIRDGLMTGRQKQAQHHMVEAGRYLSGILLPSEVNSYLMRSLARVGEDGLRVRLCLDETLVDAPWEFMHRPDAFKEEIMEGFLVLNPRVSLVREAPVESSKLEPSQNQQRMVFLGALYEGGMDHWRVGEERQKLIQSVEPVKKFLQIDEKFTTAGGTSIDDALNTPLSVFHYAGHVHIESGNGFVVREATKAFQNDQASDHQKALFSGRKLDVLLRRAGVRIAVFNACNSGRWAFVEPLLKAGLPALIGMQGEITVDAAIAFCQKLYSSLAVGLSLDEAVIYARLYVQEDRVMKDAPSYEWGSYMVYMPTSEAVLLPKPEQPQVQKQQEEVRRDASLIQSKRSLRLALVDAFDEDDLILLCADIEEDMKIGGTELKVDLETVGGGTKEAKILKLIDYLDRRSSLSYLVAAARRARPNISI